MNDRIAKITQSFLDSYAQMGGINHLNGPNLPSRNAIRVILDDLESLVFPGFKTEDALEQGSVQFIIAEKIHRVIRNLSNEVNRSLAYERGVVGDMVKFRAESEEIAASIIESIPALRQKIQKDVEAAYAGDPAAKSSEEVILSYPAVEAIVIFRVAHEIWRKGIPLIPRLMTEFAHSRTGIDIHPGATIGESFFIDHGTGVVIGETTVIGTRVKLYQGVTLGALSVRKEESDRKRHPTLEDEVTVYSGATILGGRTVVGKGAIIGGNVWLTRSVAPYAVVTVKEADYVIRQKNDDYIDFQI